MGVASIFGKMETIIRANFRGEKWKAKDFGVLEMETSMLESTKMV